MEKQRSNTGLWQDAAAQKRWLRRFFLLAAVLLLPAVILAFYARPSADDYVYAARTHAVVQQYGLDLPRLLAAAWDTNVYYFHNWQGLYVSGFVLALQPAIFGNAWYGLTLLCVLAPLLACLYGAARLTVRALAPQQKYLPAALAVLLLYAFVQGMPAPVEGLYWFNGAMNYQPYFALAVLHAALAFVLALPGASRLTRAALAAAGAVSAYKSQYYMMYSLNRQVFETSMLEIIAEPSPESEAQERRDEEYRQKVLDNFFEYGRLKSIPAQRKKERIVLERIAEAFEFDELYTEREVNLKIAEFHDDFCTIRRDMVGEGLFARDKGLYTRLR